MLQLFEERRSLAEERAQMKVSERLLINKEQKESVRNVQVSHRFNIVVLGKKKESLERQRTNIICHE